MSHDEWACRPTPRCKSLRQVVAERRKRRAKRWDWLQKQATGLFVAYAEPKKRKVQKSVKGDPPGAFLFLGLCSCKKGTRDLEREC